MRATGIVRRVDDLGRIVISKEVRKRLHIREGDPLELYLDGENIVFKRFDCYENYIEQVKTLKNRISDDEDIPNKTVVLSAIQNLLNTLKGGTDNGMA